MYRLLEADHYINKKSSLWAAATVPSRRPWDLVAGRHQVTLSYRKDCFSRIKERNKHVWKSSGAREK